MVNKPAKGKRSKTRHLFKREKKRLTIATQLAEFAIGDKVHIKIDSSVHSGLPHKRFQGRTGTVVGKMGKGFLVEVYLGNQLNEINVTASHLRTVKPQAKKTKEAA